jgi:hypothetical protein
VFYTSKSSHGTDEIFIEEFTVSALQLVRGRKRQENHLDVYTHFDERKFHHIPGSFF